MIKVFSTICVASMAITGSLQDDEVAPAITPDMVNGCESLGYCQNMPAYPKDLIDKLIQEAGGTLPESPESVMRSGEKNFYETDYIKTCNAKTEFIQPQAVYREHLGEWAWVVTSPGYTVEICNSSTASPCVGVKTQEGYISECVQKYMYIEIYLLGQKERTINKGTLKIPSCCRCQGACNDDGTKAQ